MTTPTRGTYRNHLDAELHVMRPYSAVLGGDRHNVLHVGGIWLAETRDPLSGPQEWLVTAEGLHMAGYELIEATYEPKGAR